MATLIVLCGLPCSGKTTLALHIERERGALRLCPDEWIEALLPPGPPQRAEMDRLRGPVEILQWELALRVLALDVDVVMEFGAWRRTDRDRMRAEAAATGAAYELVYLDVPLDELLARAAKRNAETPSGVFRLTEDEFRSWWEWMEPPTDEELALNWA